MKTLKQVREDAALMVIRRCKADGYHGNGDEPCGICSDAARGIRAMRVDGPCGKCGGEGFTVVYGHGGDAEQEMCDECDPGGYCIVPGCENRHGEGTFEGPICLPCAMGFRENGRGPSPYDAASKLVLAGRREEMRGEWKRERQVRLWEAIEGWCEARVRSQTMTQEKLRAVIESIVFGCLACGGSGRVLGDFGESLEPCSHCQGANAISYPSKKWPKSTVVQVDDPSAFGEFLRKNRQAVMGVFRSERWLPAPAPCATLWTGLLTGGQAGVDWVGARNALGSVLASLEAREGDVVALRVELRSPEQEPT